MANLGERLKNLKEHPETNSKVENAVKRLVLINTHLFRIMNDSKNEFSSIQRNIAEGHRLMKDLEKVEKVLGDSLLYQISLLHFVQNPLSTMEKVQDELKSLEQGNVLTPVVSKGSIQPKRDEIERLLSQESPDEPFVAHFRKMLVDLRQGEVSKIAHRLRDDKEFFPGEHSKLMDEFAHYSKKFFSAYHDVFRNVLGVERLPFLHEAEFSYFYTLLGDDVDERHRSDVQKAIHKLEIEFH